MPFPTLFPCARLRAQLIPQLRARLRVHLRVHLRARLRARLRAPRPDAGPLRQPAAALLGLVLLLAGCVANSTFPSSYFRTAEITLDDLAGEYANVVVTPEGEYEGELARLLLGGRVDRISVERVRLEPSVDGSKLRCLAITSDEVVASRTFEVGEDLELDGDTANFGSGFGWFDSDQPGAFHLGLSREKLTLRLSADGDAVLRLREYGLVVLILPPLPLLLYEEKDRAFQRIE